LEVGSTGGGVSLAEPPHAETPQASTLQARIEASLGNTCSNFVISYG